MMCDEMGKFIDAIMCAIADNTNAVIPVNALAIEKQIFMRRT